MVSDQAFNLSIVELSSIRSHFLTSRTFHITSSMTCHVIICLCFTHSTIWPNFKHFKLNIQYGDQYRNMTAAILGGFEYQLSILSNIKHLSFVYMHFSCNELLLTQVYMFSSSAPLSRPWERVCTRCHKYDIGNKYKKMCIPHLCILPSLIALKVYFLFEDVVSIVFPMRQPSRKRYIF